MTTAMSRRGSYLDRPSSSSLADVVELILDKGLVIDIYVRVSLVGIELLTIDARIVIASVDTYLRFAEAVNRLDLTENGPKGLPDLMGDLTQGGARRTSKGALQGVTETVKEALPGRGDDEDREPAPPASAPRPGYGPVTSCYVYGIVPAAARLPGGLSGLGGEGCRLVRAADEAPGAVISAVDAGRPLGTPADLRAHAGVLEAVAKTEPVLPMQFGAVLEDDDAVLGELLDPYSGEFASRLDYLRDREEFTIRGRYEDDVALREILAEEPEVRRLRELLRGQDPETARWENIRLGELVAEALERKRQADTAALAGALAGHAADVADRDAQADDIAADLAFLVDRPRRRAFEDAAQEAGKRWQGRIRLRLAGPLPPYDFAQLAPQ